MEGADLCDLLEMGQRSQQFVCHRTQGKTGALDLEEKKEK